MMDGCDIPVIAGGDETGAFLMALAVLGRFYDKLEGVIHDGGKREEEVVCFQEAKRYK